MSLTPAGTGEATSSLEWHFAAWRAFAWGLPAAAIIWGVLSLERGFQSYHFNLPVALGDASYAVYLFHLIVADGFDLPPTARVLVGIGLGWTIHLAVERRLLEWRRRAVVAIQMRTSDRPAAA